ncbi:CDP-glycerol glycerophosphotransferase family protein [Oerskovia sp. KBS0722]|uniref:CDP-glycerol glycerophosphotransferase family protein n=1 Tax=Oerskovia sp. KBS0722 TaxID=1179673 RepID=UPI00143D2B37|nr:CDP-glycerol glycerophosphotransferase family protein [Oerskovia sp. KBS0722]
MTSQTKTPRAERVRRTLKTTILRARTEWTPGGGSPRDRFRYGNDLFRAGRYDEARKHIGSAITSEPGVAQWHYRLGFIEERLGNFDAALEAYSNALALSPAIAEWYYRSARCHAHLGAREAARSNHEIALRLDPGHERAAKALIASMPSTLPHWQQLATYRIVSPVLGAESRYRHAELAHLMGSHQEAVELLTELHVQSPGSADSHLALAESLRHLGRDDEADTAFYQAAAIQSPSEHEDLGPGWLYEQRGLWEQATSLYVHHWDTGNTSARIAFRIGYCFDRQYLWEDAATWFRRAIALDPLTAYWHYKLGHALERLEEYEAAATTYVSAIVLGKGKHLDWHYRLGTCLYKTGDYRQSLAALLRFAEHHDAAQDGGSAEGDAQRPHAASIWSQGRERIAALALDTARSTPTDPDKWLVAARLLQGAGMLEMALHAYEQHDAREVTKSTAVAAERAVVIDQAGHTKVACDAILKSRPFARPDGLPLQALTKGVQARRRFFYHEVREARPVDDSVIMFESYWGDKISCNPLAIYRHLLEDSRFENHTFVWSAKPATAIPPDVARDPRTIVAPYGSDLYLTHLATAGTLVNNTTFVDYFTRRDGQAYINTWHGTPLKTLGKRVRSGVLEHANITRNFLNATHLLVPNDHTGHSLISDYDIEEIFVGTVETIGSPRLDALINASPSAAPDTLRKIGLEPSQTLGKRIIFYAPTWRGSSNSRTMDILSAQEDLNAMSSVEDTIVLYRMHHLVEDQFRGMSVNAVAVPDSVDTYEVLTVTDTLVTDYSSLMFDFLVTGRRVLLYAPDLQQYKADRGFYFDPSEKFDNVSASREELVAALRRTDNSHGPMYESTREEFARLEDGSAAKRAADVILDRPGPRPEPTRSRRTLVFHSSLIPNGISSALINLLSGLDRSRYRAVLIVEPSALIANPERQAILAQVPDWVQLVSRTGVLSATVEERWVVDGLTRTGRLSSAHRDLFRSAHAREIRRILGPLHDVHFIEFEGYSLFWMALFASAPRENVRLAFLHNQILDEIRTKHPYLRTVASLYRSFDYIADVSTATAALNARDLVPHGYLEQSQIRVVHNSLNIDSVISRSKADVPEDAMSFTQGADGLLVSIGRFSTEKNHVDLIHAIYQVAQAHPDVKVVLIGSGHLRASLEAEIRRLKLERNFFFTGQLDNPMPLLARASAFVLTSLHEGQPQVLYEAMILGVPIVTYPTPGVIEAIEFGYGTVVDPSVSELAKALDEVLSGPSTQLCTFDGTAYNKRALAEFDSLVAAPAREDLKQ